MQWARQHSADTVTDSSGPTTVGRVYWRAQVCQDSSMPELSPNCNPVNADKILPRMPNIRAENSRLERKRKTSHLYTAKNLNKLIFNATESSSETVCHKPSMKLYRYVSILHPVKYEWKLLSGKFQALARNGSANIYIKLTQRKCIAVPRSKLRRCVKTWLGWCVKTGLY